MAAGAEPVDPPPADPPLAELHPAAAASTPPASTAAASLAARLSLIRMPLVCSMSVAAAGDSNKWVGGLRALDGLVILLLSVWLAVTAWRQTRAR